MAELENIDDECDQNDIAFVKIDDDKEAKEYGIETIPTMVLFEKGIPHIYEGDLMKEDDLLGWLLHQKRHSEIPEVTDEMMDKLIDNTPYLAVIFCKYFNKVNYEYSIVILPIAFKAVVSEPMLRLDHDSKFEDSGNHNETTVWPSQFFQIGEPDKMNHGYTSKIIIISSFTVLSIYPKRVFFLNILCYLLPLSW